MQKIIFPPNLIFQSCSMVLSISKIETKCVSFSCCCLKAHLQDAIATIIFVIGTNRLYGIQCECSHGVIANTINPTEP